MPPQIERKTPPTPPMLPEDWRALVEDMVRGLRFGHVQIVVHDSRVVQIDRTERTRLDPLTDERR